ncbi:MAG: carboxypeptidase-like regulatory domain-containing protein [Gemmatimonadaceae bacterium]
MAHYRGESVSSLAWMLAGALLCGASLGAQQPKQSVRGIVCDPNELPLAGAEVVVGERRATTNATGAFRVDSIPVGKHALTVRMIGSSAVHTVAVVVATEASELDLYLTPTAVRLPAMIADGKRAGKTQIGNSMTTVVHNGRTVYLEIPVESLCAWRTDEVERVEFGRHVCAEQTHTIADVMKEKK